MLRLDAMVCLVCSLGMALAGCGGGSDADTAGNGSDTGGGSGTGGSGGGGGTGGSGGSGGEAQTPGGYALLFGRAFEGRYLVQAEFHEAGATSGRTCTSTTEGDCTVSQCEGADDVPVPARPAAGAITVSSTDTGFTATLQPDAEGVYAPLSGTYTGGSGFGGTEAVRFVAAGGTVPAFDATLTYPLLLLLDSPTTATGALPVPRTQDLNLVFSRGTSNVELRVMSVSATSGRPSLSCAVPSEPGTLSIASSLLQQLDAGTQLMLVTWATQTIGAGDYSVALTLADQVAIPDRSAAVEITLE